METYTAYSVVVVVSTGLTLIVRWAFIYALCCKATKEQRSIKISSAHPLSISVEFPPAQADDDAPRVLMPDHSEPSS